jgi:zinc transporter ZupT
MQQQHLDAEHKRSFVRRGSSSSSLETGGGRPRFPSRSRSGSGLSKADLVRSSSDTDIKISNSTYQGVQAASVVATLVLTAHSVYFLWQWAESDHLPNLKDRPLWDQILLVWCSGWITAASTGLGALPFVCFGKPSDKTVAFCNAVAAGMMIAASLGLVAEGCMEESEPGTVLIPPLRVVMGLYAGVGFVKGSSAYVNDASAVDLVEVGVHNMKRALLIMAVMTLHSMSEGIGIGVSFHSESLGGFVSASLAIHNVPEGLAIAIVLIPRGFSLISVALWCIFSSLPQPIMAVPAFLFTQQFAFVFPIGLGVAAGAMGLVVIEELIPEALEFLPQTRVYSTVFLSMFCMGTIQFLLRQNSLLL